MKLLQMSAAKELTLTLNMFFLEMKSLIIE